jgi:predicted nucleotide-binding protein
MDKYFIFNGLTSYLIEGITNEGGWGNECGSQKETNPLNTAEVLCGLILSRHHLLSRELGSNYDSTIENAIKYLIKTQLDSGGWATGSAYLSTTKPTTKGNMSSTCWAIMAICIYYEKYPNNTVKTDLTNVIKKSINYLNKIKSDKIWSYSPELSESNLMASAYALLCLSYIHLSKSIMQKIKGKETTIKNLISESIDVLWTNKDKYFGGQNSNMSKIILFISLSNLMHSGYTTDILTQLKTYLFNLIQKLSIQTISNCYIEQQTVQQKGKSPRDFIHYMPVWIIIANALSQETMINNFSVALEKVIENIDTKYQGASYDNVSKRHTWSTGLTLIGLSLLCDDFRNFSAKGKNTIKVSEAKSTNTDINSKKVFVVHGRDKERINTITSFLNEVELSFMSWEEAVKCTNKASPVISEIISVALTRVQAVIVLFTGDDEVKLKDQFCKSDDSEEERKLTSQSRPNVIFEAGLSFGLNPNRTIFVQIGEHKNFSDLSGVHFVKFDNSDDSRKTLSNRLKIAGCILNEKYLLN